VLTELAFGDTDCLEVFEEIVQEVAGGEGEEFLLSLGSTETTGASSNLSTMEMTPVSSTDSSMDVENASKRLRRYDFEGIIEDK
jgi:hypothetical protein